jgi:DNA-directed RNA polymerase beta subunit
METEVAANSAMVVRARRAGKVTYVDATRIEIGSDHYDLKKYHGLNERTCQNQRRSSTSVTRSRKARSSLTAPRPTWRIGAGTQRPGRLHVVRRI